MELEEKLEMEKQGYQQEECHRLALSYWNETHFEIRGGGSLFEGKSVTNEAKSDTKEGWRPFVLDEGEE